MANALCLSSFGSHIAAALTSVDRIIPVTAGELDNSLPSTDTTEEFDIGTFSTAIYIPNLQCYGASSSAQSSIIQAYSNYILSITPNQNFQAFPNPDIQLSSGAVKSYYNYMTYFGWYTTSTQFVVKYRSTTSVSCFLKHVDGVIAVLS